MPDIGSSSFDNGIAIRLGRPDLSDGIVLRALRDRLKDLGRPMSLTNLRRALRNGDAEVEAFLPTLRLPPPVAPLAMPTQSLQSARRRRSFPFFSGLSRLAATRS